MRVGGWEGYGEVGGGRSLSLRSLASGSRLNLANALGKLRRLIPDQRTILAKSASNSYQDRLSQETLLRRVAHASLPRVGGKVGGWDVGGVRGRRVGASWERW